MVSSTVQTETIDDGLRCGNCQHSVDVRGMAQIVCLTHLAVFDPQRDGACREFESKRNSVSRPD